MVARRERNRLVRVEPINMRLQVPLLGGGMAAVGAREGLLARVGPQVTI